MKKYGNDYRQKGKQFEYIGKWYQCDTNRADLKKYAVFYTAAMAVAFVVYLSGLTVNNLGSHIFWILMPYMLMVFPVSYGVMGGVNLFLFCRNQERKKTDSQVVIPEEHKEHFTRAQFEKGIRRPLRCSLAVAFFGGVSAAADLLLLLQKTNAVSMKEEILFEAAAVLLCLLGIATSVKSWKIKSKCSVYDEK